MTWEASLKNCLQPSLLIPPFLDSSHLDVSLGGGVLDLSEFPRLQNLTLRFQSLEEIAKLLTHSKPCAALRFLTLVIDGVFRSNPPKYEEWIGLFSNEGSRTLCHKIDHILSAEQNDSDEGVSIILLTFKSEFGFSRDIVDGLEEAVEAAFPKLLRASALNTKFPIRGK